MALTGIEIFKLLPKSNCKKCGFPTCLAFAMKVAQGQVNIDNCPDLSDDVKAKLKEASTPPIRGIEFGSNFNRLKIGQETVLFRHEKKFNNPTVLAYELCDTDQEFDSKLEHVLSSSFERVGQVLKIDCLFLSNLSKDIGTYKEAIDKVFSKSKEIALVLNAQEPEILRTALNEIKDHRPIIYCSTSERIEEFSRIAKEYDAPLVVSERGIEGVMNLIEKAKAFGVEDLLIDTRPKTAGEILRDYTIIRRGALRRSHKSLGYPIFTVIPKSDELYESMLASLAILRYSSIVVLRSIPKWKILALSTLKQNIYSDPQVPMQVKEGIYKVGEPDSNSPLIVTTNFALTYFLVKGEIENSKVPTWLAIMDCDGMSVLTAWAAGKFSASKIAEFIKRSGIEEKLSHRELIIPGYVAMLKGAIEDKLPGWKVIVGTKEANAIPAFLRNYMRERK